MAVLAAFESQAVLEKEAALDTATERLSNALRRAFAKQERILLAELRPLRSRFAALESPRPIADAEWQVALAVALASTQDEILAAWAAGVTDAMTVGGGMAAADFQIAFDIENPRAAAYLRAEGAKLITRIEATTRRRVELEIGKMLDEGVGWPEFAKRLRTKFRDFRTKKPQRHIRDRADLIAVTETGNAFEAASEIVGLDLQDAGIPMEKSWLTVGDERVSPGCRANQERGWIPLKEIFPSGHSRPLRHPGCRCSSLRQIIRNRDGE